MLRNAIRAQFLLLSILFPAASVAQTPTTVAESSDFKATSRHADVVAFCEQLARSAPDVVRLGEFGVSEEGRKMPLLILADPPVATPEEAARSSRLVVFVQANIHAGEIDGKEAILMLAREIAQARERPLLKKLILCIAPDVNPDGNDRLARNRPGQNGPVEVGTRANAKGYDLNRDFVKLETAEVRAMVRLCRQWDPAIYVDMHTTNGSYHRYPLTYDGPRHPNISEKLTTYVRDVLFPDVGTRLEKKTGFPSFFYGNFERNHTTWEAYPAQLRYGTQYIGMRGKIAILSESYAYASYKDRVIAGREFVRSILEFANENIDTIRSVIREAAKPSQTIALAHKLVARPQPAKVLGFAQTDRRDDTTKPVEYTVQHMDIAEATANVNRCNAYLIPAELSKIAENLQRHGIEVQELREDIELKCESPIIVKMSSAARPFQNHSLKSLDVTPPRALSRRFQAGSFIVRTDDSLGRLASFLLEGGSEDGLAVWNFCDQLLKTGESFPIYRLTDDTPILTGNVRPLPEERTMNRRVQVGHYLGSMAMPNLNGNAIRGLVWLKDGAHFLQNKRGRTLKVEAATGRTEPFYGEEKLAIAISNELKISKDDAKEIATNRFNRMNPPQTGFLFDYRGSLCYAALDGSKVVRLTSVPGLRQKVTFSPDGQWVAFVRNHNLYSVDVATHTEHQLTKDGSDKVSNAKSDWVYTEEVFDRRDQSFWWSPDSTRIAFVRYDDAPVPSFTVINHLPSTQRLEQTPYPLAGEPNPHVKLGVVNAAGGPVNFVPTPDYKPDDILLTRAFWPPDGKELFFHVQDRIQTWLDVLSVPVSADGALAGPAHRLLRDSTKAWVEDPGEPKFLKDGSFLMLSERDGWKHLYHYGNDGKLIRRITEGPWEVRHVHYVDEEKGWVYVSTTSESPIAENIDRFPLRTDGPRVPLTHGGDRRAAFSPTGSYFIDYASSHLAPPSVTLRRADGSVERRLDTDPVYAIEEFKLGREDYVKIPLKDGFVLEGTVLLPVDYDPSQKYPVWFMTYGGPHAPTVSDSWGFHVLDHVLSSLGIIVFHCDPRSASGKGAVSTWTAYRQLGIQETKDVEEALDWLAAKYPCVDTTHIGMSGASYGGFLTAFCMTHSEKFAAGVAGSLVTDWHLYDSIYTERYMKTPKENPAGYEKSSVLRAASNLHGKLLITHGIMDDNVHIQNAVKLVEELERSNANFEMVFYPTARHGVGGPYVRHYQRTMLNFIRQTMGK
jgi:dipeptidyl aminopeptidase/acylaminoacyl peptidase